MSDKTLHLKKPSSDEPVSITLVQAPPALHGNHSMTPRQIDVNQNINPATGAPYVQVGPRPQTQIQVPAGRRFDGR